MSPVGRFLRSRTGAGVAVDANNGRTTNVSETIRLRLVERGAYEVDVDRAEYEQAKADDRLDHLLDMQMSNIPTDSWIIEPDGTEVHPYA